MSFFLGCGQPVLCAVNRGCEMSDALVQWYGARNCHEIYTETAEAGTLLYRDVCKFCTDKLSDLCTFLLTTKLDYSVLWPNYPQKCITFLRKGSHNFCHSFEPFWKMRHILGGFGL